MMKLKNIFILAAVSLMSAMAVAQNVAIIPQPCHIEQQKGTVVLGAKPTVEVDDASLMPARNTSLTLSRLRPERS